MCCYVQYILHISYIKRQCIRIRWVLLWTQPLLNILFYPITETFNMNRTTINIDPLRRWHKSRKWDYILAISFMYFAYMLCMFKISATHDSTIDTTRNYKVPVKISLAPLVVPTIRIFFTDVPFHKSHCPFSFLSRVRCCRALSPTSDQSNMSPRSNLT